MPLKDPQVLTLGELLGAATLDSCSQAASQAALDSAMTTESMPGGAGCEADCGAGGTGMEPADRGHDASQIEPLVEPLVEPAGKTKDKLKRSRYKRRARLRHLVLRPSDVTMEARRKSVTAIAVISAIMNERRNPVGVRLRAAQELLNRAWGSPPAVTSDSPVMTPEEISYAASKMRAEVARFKHHTDRMPLWLKVANDYLAEGNTQSALLVALTENPRAAQAARPSGEQKDLALPDLTEGTDEES